MPKRVLDFDALWASDKLASCAEWAQSEYAWLYGLADASGSFEMTNLRVIWGRVAAIRKNLTLERLQEVFDEFIARGLLFTWEESGKRYGHWTGSDVPGRLPAPSWRMRLEKLAPPVPCVALAAYSARFGGSKEGMAARAGASAPSRHAGVRGERTSGLKHELEEPQAQDWDLGLDWEEDLKKEVCPTPRRTQNRRRTPDAPPQHTQNCSVPGMPDGPMPVRVSDGPEALLDIYEAERGELPAAGALTPQLRRRCARWLAAGFTLEEFRAAVRRAAATPFLAGEGDRGWQASFDWLIANRSNVRKVLEGEYAPSGRAREGKSRTERRGLADLYAGAGPRPTDCGVRVNPAALERMRARQARLARSDERARFAPAPACQAAGAVSYAPSQGASDGPAAGGGPPQATSLAPDFAPKPVAFAAQPRAAPAIRKS